ncbi:hypothetical protein CYMTET_38482 [Cymbomonas tetramitiformis]|uniref:Uncharacterized protein n=1 Tax=Cymbomonas tetramitiformis TaxID=36881 RepID=A0AAE0CBX6_9CHLO|nr:hypothetical protein CYMTET_38482 [Cymbomonas tetramitiformis]
MEVVAVGWGGMEVVVLVVEMEAREALEVEGVRAAEEEVLLVIRVDWLEMMVEGYERLSRVNNPLQLAPQDVTTHAGAMRT